MREWVWRVIFGERVWNWRIFIKENIHLVSYEEVESERGASVMHPRSIFGGCLEHAWSMHGALKGDLWFLEEKKSSLMAYISRICIRFAAWRNGSLRSERRCRLLLPIYGR